MKRTFDLKIGLAVAGLTLATSVFAADTRVTEQGMRLSEAVDTSMLRQQEELSDEERARAREWNLTDRDWVKYREIMSGRRGTWSPDLDPISALGVMETDPEERRRYANLWMQVESKRVELELAFEVERMAAAKRYHGNTPLIQDQQWKREWERKKNARTHEVAMFVEPTCIDKCRELYNEVTATTGEKGSGRLDIYFAPGTSADDIGQWAQAVGIDPQEVRDRKVTLNFEDGKMSRYDVAITELPEVRTRSMETGEIKRTFTRW